MRPDFWELLDYAIAHQVRVKFSINGVKLDRSRAAQLAATDYVDVQISLDGATAAVNDHMRGPGSYDTAMRALENLAEAGFGQPKISVVMTRQNVDQLDEFAAIAAKFGAQLRITRLRRPAAELTCGTSCTPPRPSSARSTTGRSPAATGSSPVTRSSISRPTGGAGRVVCLIDPVGDVYACPFAIHDNFLAGNVRSPGGFAGVWRNSELFADLRRPQTGGACTSCSFFDACQGGCMAAKFFTGLPVDGPDPECVRGHGEQALAARSDTTVIPRSDVDHSRSAPRNSGHPWGRCR